MNNKIPTAEELNLVTAEKYCNQTGNGNFEGGWEDSDQYKQVKKLMVGFAQLHVEAALKAAAEQALIIEEELSDEQDDNGEPIVEKYSHSGGYIRDEHFVEVDRQSILNAYPKENIK